MEADGSRIVDIQSVPVVVIEGCSGCGRCVAACPVKIITLEIVGFRKHAVILREERCNRCGRCVESCLLGAIYFSAF